MTGEPVVEIPIEITEKQVREFLTGAGGLAHVALCEVLGIDPDEWLDVGRFTSDELDELVPPLTRVLRKRAAASRALVRAVEKSDEAMVVLVAGKAAVRNFADVGDAIAVEDQRAGIVDVDSEGGADAEVSGESPSVAIVRG